MKKLNFIYAASLLVNLMFVNVSFGTFEQAYPDVNVEIIDANDQIDQAEGRWSVADCGHGSIGVGNLKCCY